MGAAELILGRAALVGLELAQEERVVGRDLVPDGRDLQVDGRDLLVDGRDLLLGGLDLLLDGLDLVLDGQDLVLKAEQEVPLEVGLEGLEMCHVSYNILFCCFFYFVKHIDRTLHLSPFPF